MNNRIARRSFILNEITRYNCKEHQYLYVYRNFSWDDNHSAIQTVEICWSHATVLQLEHLDILSRWLVPMDHASFACTRVITSGAAQFNYFPALNGPIIANCAVEVLKKSLWLVTV